MSICIRNVGCKIIFGDDDSIKSKIEFYRDNILLFDTIGKTNVTKNLRMRIEMARLRQLTKNREINFRLVDGKQQLTDCMTKRAA